MAIPAQRDPELTRKTLEQWLAAKLPHSSDVAVSELTAPGGSGFSNETLLFDATWSDDDGPHAEGMVVRLKPPGYAVFMDTDVARQYRILDALHGRSAVRVPRPLWLEEDGA